MEEKRTVIFKGRKGSCSFDLSIIEKFQKLGYIAPLKNLKGMYVSETSQEELERVLASVKQGVVVVKHSEESAIQGKNEKRTCVLCLKERKMKGFQEDESKICNYCKNNQPKEGFVKVKNVDREWVTTISLHKASHLLYMKKAFGLDRKTIAIFDENFLKELKKEQEMYQPNILVSLSGRWSVEIDGKKLKELQEEGFVEYMYDNIYRRTLSIQQLKEKVLEREKYICYYCKKKGDGVMFGKVPVLAKSVTICLPCERKRNPNFLLKWLGVKEAESHKEEIWLLEKDRKNKCRIYRRDADRLLKGNMAIQIGGNAIKMVYTRNEFKTIILEKYQRTCFYCKKPGDTIDHVIPKSRGGVTTIENCVCSCKKCNEEKSNLHIDDFIEV